MPSHCELLRCDACAGCMSGQSHKVVCPALCSLMVCMCLYCRRCIVTGRSCLRSRCDICLRSDPCNWQAGGWRGGAGEDAAPQPDRQARGGGHSAQAGPVWRAALPPVHAAGPLRALCLRRGRRGVGTAVCGSCDLRPVRAGARPATPKASARLDATAAGLVLALKLWAAAG